VGLKTVPETISVTIDRLGAQGDGIGEYEGVPVYVPFALPGERVTVSVSEKKRGGLYTQLVSVNQPSASRREPECKHFGSCGGCQLQHLDTGYYQQWIRHRAGMALSQHGFEDVTILEPFFAPVASRRRAAFKVHKGGSGVVLGFSAKNSHQIINLSECPVSSNAIMQILPALKRLLNRVLPARSVATVYCTAASNGLDILVDSNLKLDLQARELLADFAETHDIAGLHWQQDGFMDPVAIRREPVMDFAGVKVPLPPASFIQVSAACESAMVAHVVDACKGYGRVADLFCGIGTFSFPLAHDHQLLAVEGAQAAIQSLELARNASTAQGVRLKQIVTKHRDLFRRPLTAAELAGFEAVVIDPPRAGAQAQMAELAKSSVERIVSVSCNPNTFARDARILADGGYALDSVFPVDQFLWSSHLELVGVFAK